MRMVLVLLVLVLLVLLVLVLVLVLVAAWLLVRRWHYQAPRLVVSEQGCSLMMIRSRIGTTPKAPLQMRTPRPLLWSQQPTSLAAAAAAAAATPGSAAARP